MTALLGTAWLVAQDVAAFALAAACVTPLLEPLWALACDLAYVALAGLYLAGSALALYLL